MLSRVAETIYWMQRYIERAENTARFVDVNLHLMLDLPADMAEQWDPLVQVTGDQEVFEDRYETATREHVIEFLTFDRSSHSSILNSLSMARENARSVREVISSEMWEHINTLYLMVQQAASGKVMESPHDFFTRVKMGCHLMTGIAEATMSHDEGWHFGQLGGMLERADNTSRILDVKYFILLPQVQDVGTPFDNIGWSALLKSASALEMYRKEYGPINPNHVAAFLILDRDFPRAMNFCLHEADNSLHAITGSPVGASVNPAEHALGRLCAELNYLQIQEIIDRGLHEFMDEIQQQIITIDQAILESFFALRPAENRV